MSETTLADKIDQVIRVLRTTKATLLHTRAVAGEAGLDVHTTGMILTRLHREGKVARYFPRKGNPLDDKLWSWQQCEITRDTTDK